MHFSNQITIGRPLHEVFEFIADPENIPKWNYAIEETRKTSDGPVGVGTTYRQVRTIPNRSEESVEVTELEPDERFAIHGSLGPFIGTLTYEFVDVDASTQITNTADLEASGLMKLAAPIATRRIRDAVAQNLGVLKRLLEAN